MADGGDERSAPECFICTESAPTPRRSACKCTDRHVHDACLARMLATTRHARCPVCAAPYANIQSRILVVGVEPCSKGGAVLGAVMIAIVLLGCAINTVLVCCCSDRKLLTRDEQVNYFVSILMTSVGVALVAFVGRECVATGPRALARSMLVRKRSVRVCVSKDLPVEVALPPRIGASAFVNCAIYSTL